MRYVNRFTLNFLLFFFSKRIERIKYTNRIDIKLSESIANYHQHGK